VMVSDQLTDWARDAGQPQAAKVGRLIYFAFSPSSVINLF
jgi:hypothetical protein